MSHNPAVSAVAHRASARRLARFAAFALALSLAAIGPAFSQSTVPAEVAEAGAVTVLAIAPDGTWGVATEALAGRAIPRAIERCKLKYGEATGCGHRLTTVTAGWSLGYRCGDRTIIVAEKDLATARRSAAREEAELRARYVPDLPPCEQVIMVDPDGRIAAARSAQASPSD